MDTAMPVPGSAAGETGLALRLKIRRGEYRLPTTGRAPGYVQANLAMLPADLAADFHRFCQLNPKPCPLLAASEPGDPRLPSLGADLDIRTDVARYRLWRDGAVAEEVDDLRSAWRDDLVVFAMGCSFGFEEALIENGLEVRHISLGRNVPMYRTSIATVPAGPFHGPMVVTMRPFKPADAIRAIQVTTRFPATHGAPVHIGRPEQIGIRDITKPDYGDAVPVHDDELPVYWACGVTPQAVIATVKPKFSITHAPGYMLVTDLLNARLALL
jgi:uncharacterized protein YcsI (UPF0317 family)